MYILISRLNVWQVNGVDKYDILDNPIFLRNKCRLFGSVDEYI